MESSSINKKNINIKKILLCISIIPYIIFLILGIINFISSSLDNGYLDLCALVSPITDFWFEIIADVNIALILLAMVCVCYPIFYLIDLKSSKKIVSDNDKKIDKSFVIYIISFIPYLFLVYSGIFGIEFGFFFSSSMYYGFTAIMIAFLLFSIIPIYPILLIFQIIYTIKKYKTFTNKCKNITKTIVIGLILLLIVPSVGHKIIEKVNLNNTYEKDRIIIEEYLKNEFGEEHYENMEILKPYKHLSLFYDIKTPLLDDEFFSVQLNDSRTEVISNEFYEDFIEENNIQSKLSDYLKKSLELPSNIKITGTITGFDVKNYDKDDDINMLLSKCEYNIDTIYISAYEFNQEEVIQIIKDFYINYDDELSSHNLKDFLLFVVNVNEKNYARITTYNNENYLTLNFSGYKYSGSNNWTIENERISVDLSS